MDGPAPAVAIALHAAWRELRAELDRHGFTRVARWTVLPPERDLGIGWNMLVGLEVVGTNGTRELRVSKAVDGAVLVHKKVRAMKRFVTPSSQVPEIRPSISGTKRFVPEEPSEP